MAVSSVHQVARRIAADIAAEESGAGTHVGTEQELCVRYGVSPTIFRQAARLLEASGIAVMRPGNRGGLIANGPALDGVARTIGAYLQFTGVRVADVSVVSWSLMTLMGRLAAERMTVGDIDRIRASLAALERSDEVYESGVRRTDIFHQIALATANPLLALLSRVTLDYLVDVIPFERNEAPTPTIVVQPAQIAEAVIGGDIDGVAKRLHDYRLMHQELIPMDQIDLRDGAADAADVEVGSDRTRSARLARRLLGEIRRKAWPVGARLGEEPELMTRYGVSRATFRQAVRMLEEYAAVETRRGPRGGLFVTAPNPDRVAEIAVSTLRNSRASRADSREVSTALVLLAFELAVARERSAETKEIAAKLGRIATIASDRPRDAASELIRCLADASANRALAFALQLIAAFDRSLRPEPEPEENETAATLVDQFATAYRAGDLTRARRVLVDLARR